eukprot:1176830-Prorocentrum_minimum.AAC.5
MRRDANALFAAFGHTGPRCRSCDVREYLGGELNSPVVEWLNDKGLMAVSSPGGCAHMGGSSAEDSGGSSLTTLKWRARAASQINKLLLYQ